MFADANPQGFGLMQRSSKFEHFQDLQARYERRPNAWVEPIGEWGKGSVELVEIPTQGEFNDNIVAFWRPVEAIPPNATQAFSYLLRWGPPVGDPRLAQVIATRSGLTLHDKRRLFVIDFQAAKGGDLELDKSIQVKVSASRGTLRHVVGRPNEIDGGYRVSFELEPGGEELSELSLVLLRDGKVVSERWLFRWTND